MFVILQAFTDQRDRAAEYVAGHEQWLERGVDDGVFLVAGGLNSGIGGAILAHTASPSDLRSRVNEDPFVVAGIVSAEILEIAPSLAVHPLRFLLD